MSQIIQTIFNVLVIVAFIDFGFNVVKKHYWEIINTNAFLEKYQSVLETAMILYFVVTVVKDT